MHFYLWLEWWFRLVFGTHCMQPFRILKQQLVKCIKDNAVTILFLFISSFIHKMNTAEFKSATFPNAGPRHLLDDSVMEPHVPSRGQAESSTLSSGISIGRNCKHTCIIHGLLKGFSISSWWLYKRSTILEYKFYFRTNLRNVAERAA